MRAGPIGLGKRWQLRWPRSQCVDGGTSLTYMSKMAKASLRMVSGFSWSFCVLKNFSKSPLDTCVLP